MYLPVSAQDSGRLFEVPAQGRLARGADGADIWETTSIGQPWLAWLVNYMMTSVAPRLFTDTDDADSSALRRRQSAGSGTSNTNVIVGVVVGVVLGVFIICTGTFIYVYRQSLRRIQRRNRRRRPKSTSSKGSSKSSAGGDAAPPPPPPPPAGDGG